MQLSRRAFAAGAAGVFLPFEASAAAVADPRLRALFDAFTEDLLAATPEQATLLGLDSGPRARLRRSLTDRSAAAAVRDRDVCLERLRRLDAIPLETLSGLDLIRCNAVRAAFTLGAEGGAFGYGDNSFTAAMTENATPYIVNQQNGVFSFIPEFLNAYHKIDAREDCDAYIARLRLFARQLDAESARVSADARRGIIAPDFILDTALEQMRAARTQPAADTSIVRSLAMRAAAKNIAGDFATPAARIVEREIYPALDRQIAALSAVRAHAVHDAGVWRLPRGEEYYAWHLKGSTSTNLTPDEVHQMGIEQGRAIDAQMDALLRAQGLSQGAVGERMSALTRDPRFLEPNTDEGRARIIAYCEGRIAALRPLLPRLSRMPLRAEAEVRRVPQQIEAGAGLGYMNFAAIDGSRPAIYYINLKDTALWPRWTLPTLTAHETIPGHAWQGAYLAERSSEVPTIFSLMAFNAYVEGWALYAEQLADELGFYADDPFGRLGYLQAQRFRASRLVVDTGLHAKRWSREQATQTLIADTGRAPAAAQSEIDRYCSTPGQACGYKVGHTEILRLRQKAFAALGARFDLRDFDDAVIETGGVPLTVLEQAIDAYIARKAR
ncbi:MAG: DUF885 family protein [Hyphomonadaceae bacterium]|nr:DUF885 family protein [Hyphomonadaceae bacterium]